MLVVTDAGTVPVPLPPVTDIPCAHLELPDTHRDAVADRYHLQKPHDTMEVSQKAVVTWPAADVVDVELDVNDVYKNEVNQINHSEDT